MSGRIVLVGTPIGNLGDLSPRAAAALAGADVIFCEDTRQTRKLLSAVGVPAPPLIALHGHNEASAAGRAVGMAAAGETVAVVADAGMPGISDPGRAVVAAAAAAGVAVEAVPGPSAGITALVLSGLPTDRWCFEGFLPRSGGARKARIAATAHEERTVVMYESPRRLAATLDDLASDCGGDRRVAVARELTKLYEEVWRGPLRDAAAWARQATPRGEVVLVLEGAQRQVPGDDAVRDALAARLAAGVERREAVAEVSSDLGVQKRRVYALALELHRPS
jgi:16S rRNA (cytidine1402-2'-O)-methyltransferase